ncbi:MAG: hypothetical protein FWF60_08825, partial [Oscillospiraceae bacterium]|nr:hypothetical protein [Oscillospiraceae bacterium]
GEAHDIALIDTEKYDEFEDCYTVEPDAAWLESDGLHVILSGYSGNAHMFMNSVHLIIALDGSGITQYDDGDAPDYGRYPLHKPFETRDINGEDEFSGYSIRVGWDTFEPVLTPEDLSGLGLPDGPFFRDDDFADVRDVEYADGALFFTIVQGPRDPAQDIGWREGYDIASVHVYRKDVASGQINILYSFASIFD